MKVTIDSGEVPSAAGKEGPELFNVISKWVGIASLDFPFDCSALLKMIEETDRYRLWEKDCGGRTYPDRDTFLREEVLIDYDLTTERVKAIEEALKRGQKAEAQRLADESRAEQERLEARILELKGDGLSERKIAAEVGKSQPTVHRVIQKSVMKKDESPAPRKLVVYQLNQGTKPTVAALKIRQKFGDEFADALKEAL